MIIQTKFSRRKKYQIMKNKHNYYGLFDTEKLKI